MRPKNWAEFQHYRNRRPPWIKLHRAILDDFDFCCLPLASKALAPLLWLLAADETDGTLPADAERIAHRLRWTVQDVSAGLKPLIEKGFMILASGVLAECKQVASAETEGETETEREGDLDSLRSSYESPDGDPKPERQSPIVTKVLAAYHAKLPKCLAVAVVGPKRKKRILAADKLARSVCKNQGWEYDPEVFWGEYFGDCSRDAWMRGEVPNPKNANWKQNIDVLLAEDRFAGIMDRALESMRDGT
jgi:hypothetical protein